MDTTSFWTEHKEKTLSKLVKRYGHKWSRIKRRLRCHFSESQIKLRYCEILEREKWKVTQDLSLIENIFASYIKNPIPIEGKSILDCKKRVKILKKGVLEQVYSTHSQEGKKLFKAEDSCSESDDSDDSDICVISKIPPKKSTNKVRSLKENLVKPNTPNYRSQISIKVKKENPHKSSCLTPFRKKRHRKDTSKTRIAQDGRASPMPASKDMNQVKRKCVSQSLKEEPDSLTKPIPDIKAVYRHMFPKPIEELTLEQKIFVCKEISALPLSENIDWTKIRKCLKCSLPSDFLCKYWRYMCMEVVLKYIEHWKNCPQYVPNLFEKFPNIKAYIPKDLSCFVVKTCRTFNEMLLFDLCYQFNLAKHNSK
ncbi:unnamed protein product [Moneuplotes crassus]|uniref:Myb-like domain-containing protein n=1 Tax=Euplotes crassus TaxID=5936 RepID=A0AAD1X6U3_EUPCR|nr:unnamed protein product [Moneuplotes crassus]